MTLAPVDFNTVQWARKKTASLQPFLSGSAEDLEKMAQLLSKLAPLKSEGVVPTEAQMNVILQNLYTKNLDKLEAVKGGMMVYFSGGGFEFEQFLLKNDGRVPNHKYLSKKIK